MKKIIFDFFEKNKQQFKPMAIITIGSFLYLIIISLLFRFDFIMEIFFFSLYISFFLMYIPEAYKKIPKKEIINNFKNYTTFILIRFILIIFLQKIITIPIYVYLSISISTFVGIIITFTYLEAKKLFLKPRKYDY